MNTGKLEVEEDERKAKTSMPSSSRTMTGEVHFLGEKSVIEIHSSAEEDDDDDDSMEFSDDTFTSGEDNEDSDDLDYCGEEEEEMEEREKEKERKNHSADDVVCLNEESGVEIQQRKQNARGVAAAEEEEEEEEESDSMDEFTSEEDNEEPEDLDYSGEVEEEEREKKKKKNHHCSSGSDDNIVCLNDFSSSYAKSSKGKKSEASSSEKLHLLTTLADTILNNEETENSPLSVKSTSSFEDTPAPQNEGFEDELDPLWAEMQFCLASDEIGSTKPCQVETANVSEVKPDRATLCGQGHHELVLDEEIGIICKFCTHVELEIKYVVAPFLKCPYGQYEGQHSGTVVDSSVFDGIQELDPNINMPGFGSSANIEGTVWEIIPNMKDKLHLHQREGFEFMWNNIAGGIYRDKSKNSSSGGGGCIVSHAPGTGKTLLTIVFLQTYLKEYPNSYPVIVAPYSMLLTWRDEFIKWKVDIPFHNLNGDDFSDKEETYGLSVCRKLKAGIPHSDKHTRRLVKLLSWKSSGGILGISYSLFTKLAGKKTGGKRKCKDLDDQIRKILLELPGIFVFDEGHIPRNAGSLLWKALAGIKTERRIILSGTPFQNNFKELFNTLWIVRPKFAEGIQYKEKKRRGRKGDQEKLKFTYWIGSIENEVDRNDKLREVRALIKPFVHVYKGTILQTALPGLKHSLVVLRPTDLQKKILACVEEILERVEEILEGARKKKNPVKRRRKKETVNALDLDRYASLISIHPSLLKQLLNPLLDEKDINEVVSSIVSMKELERIRLKPDEGVKTKFLMNLLKLSEALQEKVIVFSQHIGPLRLIMEQLQDQLKWKEGEEILFMHGLCDIRQRQCSINAFNDPKSKARVLLASTKACSEGINLVGGSRLVLLDVTWNPSVERQAISRAYRLGQRKVVYVYHLISTGPMEASKYHRQAGKDRLSELLFSSSDKGDHHKQVSNIVEDRVLEEMFRHETVKSMFEKAGVLRSSYLLFGGTKILQHTADKSFPLRTPDGGCLAVVLRTGFETSQGKLMRTILFSTERVTANSWESGLFILFLVVFAIIAAGYVLKKGLEDPTRSKYKLFLSCSLIITSVIPPELPMELSIAVNTSLIALARRGIFCTGAFSNPICWKVLLAVYFHRLTYVVSIKLTSDDMEFSGVVGLNDSSELESDMTKVPSRTVEILASCHALVFVDNKLVGDPLEKAALKGIDWSYKSDEKAVPRKGTGNSVQIVQRHHFASHLKRMAVVVRVQEEFFAFVKVLWILEMQ
ncbi:hypothetical protein GQ457_11G011050 [Hibiscus cannabinus]